MIARALSLICLVTALWQSAFAQDISLTGSSPKHLTVTVLSELSDIAPGKSFKVALRLEHDEHWHTYGKTLEKDVTGKPTSVTWTLPDGWKADDLPWPATREVNSTGGSKTKGYDGVVYLPAQLTPPAGLKAGSTVKLEATLDALICDPSTCMPVTMTASLEVKVGAAPVVDAKNAEVFKALATQAAAAPEKKNNVIDAPRDGSIAYYLLLAFLGGMILNVMPCVFPVLAIKLTGVVSQAHDDKRKLMLHGVAYTPVSYTHLTLPTKRIV